MRSSRKGAWSISGLAGMIRQRLRLRLLRVDAVEKGFFSFDRVRLIRDQAQARNVDSKNQSSRFDCCVFLFHSFRAVTFSTASVKMRKAQHEYLFSGLPQ